MKVFMRNNQNYKCNGLDDLLGDYNREAIDYVTPNTLREAFTLMTWGYQVRTHPGIPVDYPVFKVGDKFKPTGAYKCYDAYEITDILTYYNSIIYFGRLTFYKTEYVEKNIQVPLDKPLSEYETRRLKVTKDHYQVNEKELEKWKVINDEE